MEIKLTLGVFASGNGSNCKAIQKAIDDGKLGARIGLIISNTREAGVLRFAKERNIPSAYLSSSEFSRIEDFHSKVLATLQENSVDFIILAGYMKKVGHPILDVYRNRVLNIHPALLPAFGGKGLYGEKVHAAVLAYGAKISGVTIHLVDSEYDHGAVVMQRAIDVKSEDTAETLAERVLELEHETYHKAIQLFVEDKVQVIDRIVRIKP